MKNAILLAITFFFAAAQANQVATSENPGSTFVLKYPSGALSAFAGEMWFNRITDRSTEGLAKISSLAKDSLYMQQNIELYNEMSLALAEPIFRSNLLAQLHKRADLNNMNFDRIYLLYFVQQDVTRFDQPNCGHVMSQVSILLVDKNDQVVGGSTSRLANCELDREQMIRAGDIDYLRNVPQTIRQIIDSNAERFLLNAADHLRPDQSTSPLSNYSN